MVSQFDAFDDLFEALVCELENFKMDEVHKLTFSMGRYICKLYFKLDCYK